MNATTPTKIAVVTGSADGIGACIVRRLVEDGHSVVAADINEELGNTSIQNLGDRVTFKRTDVTNESDIIALVAHTQATHGSVDILVNNAWGGGGMDHIENKTNELLQHGLNMSMYAAFWAMRESFPIVDSCLVRRDSSLARG